MQHQNILIHKQPHDAFTQHQTYFFQFFAIINKKEQAINFAPEIFYSYDTYTLLIFHHKQKEEAMINLP